MRSSSVQITRIAQFNSKARSANYKNLMLQWLHPSKFEGPMLTGTSNFPAFCVKSQMSRECSLHGRPSGPPCSPGDGSKCSWKHNSPIHCGTFGRSCGDVDLSRSESVPSAVRARTSTKRPTWLTIVACVESCSTCTWRPSALEALALVVMPASASSGGALTTIVERRRSRLLMPPESTVPRS